MVGRVQILTCQPDPSGLPATPLNRIQSPKADGCMNQQMHALPSPQIGDKRRCSNRSRLGTPQDRSSAHGLHVKFRRIDSQDPAANQAVKFRRLFPKKQIWRMSFDCFNPETWTSCNGRDFENTHIIQSEPCRRVQLQNVLFRRALQRGDQMSCPNHRLHAPAPSFFLHPQSRQRIVSKPEQILPDSALIH